MDWPLRHFDISKEDFHDVFVYESGESRIVRKLDTDKDSLNWTLGDQAGWQDWISKDHFKPNGQLEPGVGVLLLCRSEERPEDYEKAHNGAVLEYLPFDQRTFASIANEFHIHGSVVRVINRSNDAIFSRTHGTLGNPAVPAIIYNCRSSADWKDDLALSATYLPDSNFTYVVIYGCDDERTEELVERIAICEDAAAHPMLMLGIFAEIERRRHVKLAEETTDELLDMVLAFSQSHNAPLDEKLESNHYSIETWMKTSHIRSGLETWRVMLLKMIAHVDELAETVFAADGLQAGNPNSANEAFKLQMRQAGQRIKERLQEIICDYDEKIRNCTMSMEGMTLANQLSWNQIGREDNRTNLEISKSNLTIADATKRDSNQMRKISNLTMIFLPATFVATLFSMTFFNWNSKEGESTVSPFIWLYPVVAVSLTLATGVMMYASRHGEKKENCNSNGNSSV